MICQTSNQHDFRIRWHFKQKLFIFGILSRGDLCMDNQFLGCLPCTASTASYLKDAIFLMVQWGKGCLIFQAKMISLQLEFHGHSFLLRPKIHQFLRFDLRGRFEVVWGHISKCPQMILITFSYNPNIKWPRKGLHELSASLTSEADMEAAEAGFSKWLDFKASA